VKNLNCSRSVSFSTTPCSISDCDESSQLHHNIISHIMKHFTDNKDGTFTFTVTIVISNTATSGLPSGSAKVTALRCWFRKGYAFTALCICRSYAIHIKVYSVFYVFKCQFCTETVSVMWKKWNKPDYWAPQCLADPPHSERNSN